MRLVSLICYMYVITILSYYLFQIKEGEDDSAAKVTFPAAPQESGAELERLLEEAEAVMRESNPELAASAVGL